jgi:hypothetical protein
LRAIVVSSSVRRQPESRAASAAVATGNPALAPDMNHTFDHLRRLNTRYNDTV